MRDEAVNHEQETEGEVDAKQAAHLHTGLAAVEAGFDAATGKGRLAMGSVA